MTAASRRTVIAGRLVAGIEGPGWVRVHADRVVERGAGDPPATGEPIERVDLLLPGAVDVHVHGAMGVDFAQPGVDPLPAIDHHHACGATTLVASLATSTPESMLRRVHELRPLVACGELAGIHLEGPWLSPARRGAHAPALLRTPDIRELVALLEAGEGTVRMVTLAPELPGALLLVEELVARGVVAAIGHTDADRDTVDRAVGAGASVVTHLFNGMPALHHREPGPVGAALTRPDLSVELIADGVHVDDSVVDLVLRSAPGRTLLVSDAMAATGLGDGSYTLAGSHVVVREGVARLEDGSSIAGSTSTLGATVARLAARGVPPTILAHTASAHPSAALGLAAPALRVGDRADVLTVTAGRVRAMRSGRWLDS